jgi:hypothetical protein
LAPAGTYFYYFIRIPRRAGDQGSVQCFQLVSDYSYRTHNPLPYLHVSSEECGYYRYEQQTELATWRPNTPFLNFLYHVHSAFQQSRFTVIYIPFLIDFPPMFHNWLVLSCGLAVTCKREIKLNLQKNGHSLSVLQLSIIYSWDKFVQVLISPEKNSVGILMAGIGRDIVPCKGSIRQIGNSRFSSSQWLPTHLTSRSWLTCSHSISRQDQYQIP